MIRDSRCRPYYIKPLLAITTMHWKQHIEKIIFVVGLAVVVALLVSGGQSSQTKTWRDTKVPCLAGGHQNAGTHIHAKLSLVIDGNKKTIPANVGINDTCMAEVHTHDASGKVHVEVPDGKTDRTLADFFAVWDKQLDRPGHERTVSVNGQTASSSYTFADGDTITVEYDSESGKQATTTSTTTTNRPTDTSPAGLIRATGTVTSVDFSAIVRDGDGRITIQNNQDRKRVITIPARRMQTCLVRENITDVSELSTGTPVMVQGTNAGQDNIDPCSDPDGFVRIIQ